MRQLYVRDNEWAGTGGDGRGWTGVDGERRRWMGEKTEQEKRQNLVLFCQLPALAVSVYRW